MNKLIVSAFALVCSVALVLAATISEEERELTKGRVRKNIEFFSGIIKKNMYPKPRSRIQRRIDFFNRMADEHSEAVLPVTYRKMSRLPEKQALFSPGNLIMVQ